MADDLTNYQERENYSPDSMSRLAMPPEIVGGSESLVGTFRARKVAKAGLTAPYASDAVGCERGLATDHRRAVRLPFTDDERRFLRWHGLDQDDVYDGRYQSKEDRHDAAKAEGKFLILTSVRCRTAGHRIRTRAGHCFQCDPLKLVYQIRHSKSGYVYVAGSLSGRVIKIGTAKHIGQREGQLRAERYAGFADWITLYSIHVSEAGRVEHDASARVPGRRVYSSYFKDGIEQTAVEVSKCSFSDAVKAVEASLGPTDNAAPWKARWTYQYEFR